MKKTKDEMRAEYKRAHKKLRAAQLDVFRVVFSIQNAPASTPPLIKNSRLKANTLLYFQTSV